MPNQETTILTEDGRYILLFSLLAWAIAQILKLFVGRIVNKKWNISDLWMGGGMPSSHSAFVCACSASIGMVSGFSSSTFALSAVIAFVVMYDAANVRWESGKQAKLLNFMQEHWIGNPNLPFEKKLKESLGHSPTQVAVGGLLGIFIGYVGHLLVG